MHIHRLTDPGDPLFARMMSLYAASFPVHEQRLSASQMRILGDSRYHFNCLMHDDVPVGALLLWQLPTMRYIEHFFIDPAARGRGLGTQALSLIASRDGGPLVLEIDPPDDPIAVRRKAFYLRCGFHVDPFDHVHPPYRPGCSGHKLVLLSSPRLLLPSEFHTFTAFMRDVVMRDAQR